MALPFRPRRYESIALELQVAIERGDFTRLGKLPSERVLTERFGVQRNTIRQALEVLKKEGWIRVEEKRGAFLEDRSDRRIEPLHPGALDFTTKKVFVVNAHNHASQAANKLLDGLFAALHPTGMGVLRYDSRPLGDRWIERIPTPEELSGHEVAGILLWPQNPTDAREMVHLQELAPLILIDRRVLGLSADCVRFDDQTGGRLITEHLLRQGHRRIGFIGVEAFADTVQHRWRGFMMAMEAEDLVPTSNEVALMLRGDEHLLTKAIETILGQPGEPPTAFVCSNDSTAISVIRILTEMGLRVPKDMAVAGYGDVLPEYLDTIGLTTVAQPFRDAGLAAGRLLLDRIRHGGKDYRDIELPVQVVERASCASPARLESDASAAPRP